MDDVDALGVTYNLTTDYKISLSSLKYQLLNYSSTIIGLSFDDIRRTNEIT